jgi:chromosome segregation protein
LSLSNPASQCIIIFDSDFSDANLDSVLHFLGINPTNEFEKFTVETQRISQDIIHDLVHLHKKLDELSYCKGKYVTFAKCWKWKSAFNPMTRIS